MSFPANKGHKLDVNTLKDDPEKDSKGKKEKLTAKPVQKPRNKIQ